MLGSGKIDEVVWVDRSIEDMRGIPSAVSFAATAQICHEAVGSADGVGLPDGGGSAEDEIGVAAEERDSIVNAVVDDVDDVDDVAAAGGCTGDVTKGEGHCLDRV